MTIDPANPVPRPVLPVRREIDPVSDLIERANDLSALFALVPLVAAIVIASRLVG